MHRGRWDRRLVAIGLFVFGCAVVQAETPLAFDPIREDNPVGDATSPAGVKAMSFSSGGVTLNAVLYLAQGGEPHPTVVIARGFPDYLGQMDVAMMLRRAGYNVLGFSYRGFWGSAGAFSLTSGVEDLRAAVDALRSAPVELRVDKARIILMGYSLGGLLVLKTAADEADLRMMITIDSTDVRGLFREHETTAGRVKISESLTTSAVAVATPTAIVDDYVAHRADWEPAALAPRLAGKRILQVYAARANGRFSISPSLPDLLRPHAALSLVVLETDHGFSDKRIALQSEILKWLRSQPVEHGAIVARAQ